MTTKREFHLEYKKLKWYSNPKLLLRKVFTILMELNARFHGEVFCCRALKGEGSYNSISINCDMTVSCNCHDHDNSGYIGDFSEQTMYEIFAGKFANSKREALANVILPTAYCSSCHDLIRIPKHEHKHQSATFVLPHKGLMVENTIVCNLDCGCCNRKKLISFRNKKVMSLEDIRKIALYLKENKVQYLSFFKLGEPFADKGIYDKLDIIREYNPDIHIRMSSNGALLDDDTKREAALLCDYIEFSIDGTDDQMLHKYQKGHDFQKAYDNIEQLIKYRNQKSFRRTHIEWKYLVFAHNDKPRDIKVAINYAKAAGCNAITFWPTVTPLLSYSFRYRLHPFYKTLGVATKNGRQLTFP